jgi:sugar phosphate isomerase/epimerase
MLNWDPGNAAAIGEYPYSKGFDLLPKARIGHCHAKDVAVGGEGLKYNWAPVGDGVVGWPGQIRDFLKMKYHYAISLETHWRGAGTPEASTRVSMAGLKKVLAGAGVQC